METRLVIYESLKVVINFCFSFNDIFESFKVVVLNVFFRFFYIVHADKGFVVGDWVKNNNKITFTFMERLAAS